MSIALPSGTTEIYSHTFTNDVSGSALDLYMQMTFQWEVAGEYVGIQFFVVLDGVTSACQYNGYVTIPTGIDSRSYFTEVNPLSSGSHTISIYAAAFGLNPSTVTVNCLGCLVKGVLRMN